MSAFFVALEQMQQLHTAARDRLRECPSELVEISVANHSDDIKEMLALDDDGRELVGAYLIVLG